MTHDIQDITSALEQLAQYGMPSPGAAKTLDVGTTAYVDYFAGEVLDGLVSQGGATCKIFEGTYGSGKTHLLHLLEAAALERGMAVVRTDLSTAVNFEHWDLITRHILQNIRIQTSRGVVKSLPRILDSIPVERMRPLRQLPLPHIGFANAMAMYRTGSRGGARDLLGAYLMGERVRIAALKAEGVAGVKQPLSTRNAEVVLKSVLSALHRIGVPGTLLLFDETEETFSTHRATGTKKVRLGANLLRRIIDASASGSLVATVAVFAVLPDFVSNCALTYPALGQRLQRQRATSGRPAAWRWPVIDIEHVTKHRDPREFVRALSLHYVKVLADYGIGLNGARTEMERAGMKALASHAGGDYRRYVVKSVAGTCLKHL